MDALLLALLLGLALDQGDRSQRIARALGDGGAPIWPVVLAVILGAALSAALGQLLAPYLPGPSGLLFFAVTLVVGALGLLVPMRDSRAGGTWTGIGRLFAHRLADSASFLLVGIAGMTGLGWATALGGAIGGLAALLPPLLAGATYERAVPLRVLRPILGGMLLLAGLGCAVRALGLAG